MTIQELIAKYSNTNEQMLNLIEKILQWQERVSDSQASEFIQKMASILEKHGDVQTWENVREQLVNEISRLNVERNKMKKDKESINESLQKKKQWFIDLEQAKSDLTILEEKESKLHKDDMDMQRRYIETKKMIEELQQNRWLSSTVKESINKIWAALPSDELDKALTK
jgi:chromosome segregation ATPase